jgi:hypothetical protein
MNTLESSPVSCKYSNWSGVVWRTGFIFSLMVNLIHTCIRGPSICHKHVLLW